MNTVLHARQLNRDPPLLWIQSLTLKLEEESERILFGSGDSNYAAVIFSDFLPAFKVLATHVLHKLSMSPHYSPAKDALERGFRQMAILHVLLRRLGRFVREIALKALRFGGTVQKVQIVSNCNQGGVGPSTMRP